VTHRFTVRQHRSGAGPEVILAEGAHKRESKEQVNTGRDAFLWQGNERMTVLELIPEPYATMVYVAVWCGLRVSEVIGLRWRNIHSESITVEQRYCRGDWSAPKTSASAATIGVRPTVIERLQRLKTLKVSVQSGFSVRQYPVVKSSGPDDLVFQSVRDGRPMNDQNILKRHMQPAAEQVGLRITWCSLRTSHATAA